MENLSTEKSLQIITETLQRSRQAIARNSGRPLILWGALVTLFAVIIWLLWKQTGSPVWNLLWFAMTAVGIVCNIYMARHREKVPRNEVSTTLGSVWMWFGIITTSFYAMLWVCAFIMQATKGEVSIHVNMTLIIVLLMGLCGTISGSVMRQRSVQICSLVATLLGVAASILLEGPEQILAIAVLGIIALIIPGIILQKKSAA